MNHHGRPSPPPEQPEQPEHLVVEELDLSAMSSANGDTAQNAPLILHPSPSDHDRRRARSSDTDSRSSGQLFIWALTVSAGVSGLLFGYDTGVISSTLVSINNDLSNRQLTTLDKSLITSCTSLFALVASPTAGILADILGRKKVILIADALFTFGALLQALTTSVWGMICGRSVVGLAIGGASMIVPLYITELAPGEMRGRLVTICCAFITGGQVVAYFVGWLFSTAPSGWRWMVGLGALPAILQFFFLIFMPETPRWLTKADHEDEARRVLLKVYRNTRDGVAAETSDRILRSIKREIREEEEAAMGSKPEVSTKVLGPRLSLLLLHPPNRRALTIACLLQGLQQLCGFNSLMYFSATIFSLLRFSSPTLTSLSIACTNFAFTIASFYLIDRIGRRRILLYSIPIMVLALALCALAFTFVTLPKQVTAAPSSANEPTQSRLPAIAILISLLLYVSPYAFGLGVVPWQQSELFPLSVRSTGSSISTATNWGCNFIIGLTFLPMMEHLTPRWTFICYAVVCAIGWVAVWNIYPETMGMDLEDVGQLLANGWGVEESMRRVNERKEMIDGAQEDDEEEVDEDGHV